MDSRSRPPARQPQYPECCAPPPPGSAPGRTAPLPVNPDLSLFGRWPAATPSTARGRRIPAVEQFLKVGPQLRCGWRLNDPQLTVVAGYRCLLERTPAALGGCWPGCPAALMLTSDADSKACAPWQPDVQRATLAAPPGNPLLFDAVRFHPAKYAENRAMLKWSRHACRPRNFGAWSSGRN